MAWNTYTTYMSYGQAVRTSVMSAVEFDTEQRAAVVEIGVPPVAPGEALVEVTSAGICGSDVAALRGSHPFRRPPLITGHEGGGRVVRVGSAEDRRWVGRQVAVEPQRSCGHCAACRSGLTHLCRDRLMLGMPGWPGTLAQYVTAPMRCLYPVPERVDPALLALAEPLAVAHHALRRVPEVCRRRVAVLGGGTIGALLVHLLDVAGAEPILVTDPRERSRVLCHRFGATEVVDPTRQQWRTPFAEAFDVVFVAAAAEGVVDDAVRLLAPRGTVVQVGLFGAPIRFDVSALQQDEKALTGSNVYVAEDFAAAVRTLVEGVRVLAGMADRPITLGAAAAYLNGKVRGVADESIKVLVSPSA